MSSKIGGDIAGLWALRDHLKGIPNDILDTSNHLDNQVNKLATDAGWSGNAADEFKAAWDRDAAAAVGIADSFNSVADIVGTLADTLHNLETQLTAASDTARKAGVPVPSDGGPAVGPVPVNVVDAATHYNQTCSTLAAQAHQARQQALADLVVIYDHIAPTQNDSTSPQLASGDKITLGDVVRSLWATPTAHREVVEAKLDQLRARRVWLNHIKTSPGFYDEVERAAARAEKRSLVGQLKDLDAKFSKIEGGAEGKWPLGRLFRYTVGDASEALTGLKLGAKFGGGVPVLGAAAATWLTWVQAKEDHEKGWSWEHAILADGGANAAGLAAGTAAEAGIAAGLVAAPEGIAAAGAVAGGAVAAYGVGTFGYELVHAGHWGENIHKDGVIAGIGDSFADAGKEWVKTDVVDMGHKIGNAATSAWHSVFG
jgi:uncharacterized protein YukE